MKQLSLVLATAVLVSCVNPPPAQKPATVAQEPRVLGNQSIKSFNVAKRKLALIFSNLGQKTLYCGCDFNESKVAAKSCGYKPKKARTSKGKVNLRAKRIEWEHIVPAHSFGQNLPAWQSHKTISQCQGSNSKSIGARNCARKTDDRFRHMEGDLYNLFPAVGELNGYRSHYPMAEIKGEDRNFGACDFEVKNGRVEPRPAIRGLIARVYFYMDWAYPERNILDSQPGKRQLLESWDRQFAITSWERKWAKLVEKQQGNCNPFIVSCSHFLTQGSRVIPVTGH